MQNAKKTIKSNIERLRFVCMQFEEEVNKTTAGYMTDLRPDHEGIHRSLDVVGSRGFLALRSIRVRRGRARINHLRTKHRRAVHSDLRQHLEPATTSFRITVSFHLSTSNHFTSTQILCKSSTTDVRRPHRFLNPAAAHLLPARASANGRRDHAHSRAFVYLPARLCRRLCSVADRNQNTKVNERRQTP